MAANLQVLFFLSILALLVGCKASPAPSSGFLEDEQAMQEIEAIPFHRSWWKEEVDWDKYKELYVAPVNTDFLAEMDWWDKASFAGDNKKEADEIARYMREKIKAVFQEDPEQVVTVVEKIGPNTAVLEVALVELTPTKAWLNAVGYAGVGSGVDHGTVAIESRVLDGETREVIAMFADREAGKTSLVSVADLSWYSHARSIIDDWAEQMLAIAKADEDERVKDSFFFTLKAW